MVARLALLCAVELALVIALAMAVCAPPAPAAVGVVAAPAETSAPNVSSAVDVVADQTTEPRARAESPSSPTRTAVAQKWVADDPVGVLLVGTLRLRDGSPAAASIALTLDKARHTASVGADGSYALIGVHPGEWTVNLRGQSVVERTESLTLGDEAVQRRDFVLDASVALRVRIVTSDGQDGTRALRRAMPHWGDFSIAGQRDRLPERLAPTDYGAVFVGDAKWRGEINPTEGVAGTLHLTSLPAHVALLQRHLVLEQKLVQPGQQEVEFVVDAEALKELGGVVTVRVLDAASGEPLPKARVFLWTGNRGSPGQPVDGEGRAVLEDLSPGLLRCQINAEDHEAMYTTLRVEVGERLDLGDVRLGPAEPLTGTVVDADGKPAAGVRLSWTDLKWRTAPAAFATNRVANTAADGTFSLRGTGQGRIAVTARDQAGNLAVGVFDNPPPSPIALRLAAPGECLVRRPTDPTRAFTVTLYDAQQRAIAAHTLEPRQTSLAIKLPFGDYTFEVHDDGAHLLQSGALTVAATPCHLEIR